MDDFRFLENKFSSEIKYHLVCALPRISLNYESLKMSSTEDDCKLSFDLSFDLSFKISVRIRKNEYKKYSDMTLRSRSRLGGYTEVDKIKDGLSDIYFYAYMSSDCSKLEKVRVVDVNCLRKMINNNEFVKKQNNDGTEFYAFHFSDIKKNSGDIYKFDLVV